MTVEMQQAHVAAGPQTAAEVEALVRQGLTAAFISETASRARPPGHLGLSGLFGCSRAAAYAIAKVPPSDFHEHEEGRAANLGTWEHDGLLPRLAEQLGGVYEQPVTLKVPTPSGEVVIPGHLDLYAQRIMIDLKTVGEYRLQTVRRYGDPKKVHRGQVRAYALAALQAGMPPRWLVWIYLDRANGDFEVLVEEFTNAAAFEVVDRVRYLAEMAEVDPQLAPREERGPGDPGKGFSYACNRCDWLRECWGADAKPGEAGPERMRLGVDTVAVEAALLRLWDATAERGELAKVQEEIKAALSGTPYEKYGALEWAKNRDTSKADVAAILLDFAKRGEVVPWITKFGPRGGDQSGPDLDAIRDLYKQWKAEMPWKTSEGAQRVKIVAKVKK